MLKKIWKVVAIAVLLALLLVFVPSPLNTYDAFAEIVTLPIDQTGGLKYDPANYTSDTHYEDPSITVDIYWGGRIYGYQLCVRRHRDCQCQPAAHGLRL